MIEELNTPEAQEKIAELKEMLSSMKEDEKKEDEKPSSPIKGSDVDWSEYELDPNYAHFYPHAELIQSGDKFQWVVLIWEFHSFSLPYNGRGLDVKGQPKGFAEMLTYLVNGPERWQIAQIIPNGTGLGAAVLQRKVPIVLPNPKLIETETVTEPITDEELEEESKRANAWIQNSQALEEVNDVPAEHDSVG